MRSERDVLPWSFFLAAIAAFFVASLTGHDALRQLVKPVPVWSLTVFVALRGTPLSRLIAVGLAFGSVGDIFLETGNPSHFVPGLVAFLLGHLAYVVAFTRSTSTLSLVRGVPFFGLAGVVLAVALPHAGALGGPIGVYGLVIALMMWRASVRVGSGEPALQTWLCLVGAVLFAFSDAMIAVNRFVVPFTGARPLILVTYWGAQALIALSVPDRRVAEA